MTTRILYLARHGETDWNREGRWQGQSDIALNDAGRAQARALAGELAAFGIGAVGASDLMRAHETARIVAGELELGEVAVDRGLRERGFGIFEGLTHEECDARYPEHWASYRSDIRVPPPGAEPFVDVTTRFRDALLRVHARHPRDVSVLLVSHGAAMRLFLSSITGKMPPPLANGATFRLAIEGERFRDVERLR